MILADKIIDLRKKNGWSQEELAEKLGVSRQSVSKWEGAQAVPDMNRLLGLSEIFGVSTGYLLKDDMELLEYVGGEEKGSLRSVSMEEASEFIEIKKKHSGRIAAGVMMCILSPVVLILLGGAWDGGLITCSENTVAGIGLTVLLLLIGGAVALFVRAAFALEKYDFLEEEDVEPAYGVKGMANERKAAFKKSHDRSTVAGVVLCVISAVPIFAVMIFFEENSFAVACAVSLLLSFVAAGVFLLVRAGVRQGAFDMLLEEGDYRREEKDRRRKTG